MTVGLKEIPPELKLEVIRHLDFASILSLSQVNQEFRSIIYNDTFWKETIIKFFKVDLSKEEFRSFVNNNFYFQALVKKVITGQTVNIASTIDEIEDQLRDFSALSLKKTGRITFLFLRNFAPEQFHGEYEFDDVAAFDKMCHIQLRLNQLTLDEKDFLDPVHFDKIVLVDTKFENKKTVSNYWEMGSMVYRYILPRLVHVNLDMAWSSISRKMKAVSLN